jgi:DNA-binding GntR family transcriptional regulator
VTFNEHAGEIGRTDAAYETLRARILHHEIRPGEHVKIDQVARDLHISQTPVREALVRLEADGLLAKERFRGYTATPLLSHEGFAQLFSFRRLLEPWSAETAAQKNSADLHVLSREMEDVERHVRLSDAAAPDRLYGLLAEHDVRFHALVAEMSGNRHAIESYDAMHCHMHLYRLYLSARAVVSAEGEAELASFDRHYTTQRASTETVQEHRAIADAILSGQPQEAGDYMRWHLDRSEQRALLELAIVAESQGEPTHG